MPGPFTQSVRTRLMSNPVVVPWTQPPWKVIRLAKMLLQLASRVPLAATAPLATLVAMA